MTSNVADESEDHQARGCLVSAYPLASKKAAKVLVAIQTIVGEMNSVCVCVSGRCYEDDSFGSCQQTSRRPGRSVEEKSETGQEPNVSKWHLLQEEIRQTSLVLEDVVAF